MKHEFEVRVTKDGHVEGIYQDGLSDALGANTEHVERASNVEWEDVGEGCRGWTVRSAKDPDLAIRVSAVIYDGTTPVTFVGRSDTGKPLAYFATREQALVEEVRSFWQLRGEPK